MLHTSFLWKASAKLPRSTDGKELFSDRCLLCLMWVKQNMCHFQAAGDQFIALIHSLSNDVWKQDKEAWPLFIYLYCWFYSSKLLTILKAADFKTMASITPLHFRKHAGRKQWLPNISNFFMDHPKLMPWTEVQLFSFRTWHGLNWAMCKTAVYSKPSAFSQVLLRFTRFQCPFFSHLKGRINFASHLALISGSVSRISSCSGELAGNIPVTARGSTLPEISLPQHRHFVQMMQNAVWNMETSNIFDNGQGKFLLLSWDPPCGTGVSV